MSARFAARFLVLCLAAALLDAGKVPPGRSWWSHVETLAADDMEGRATGSKGHRKAAEYVAQEFERAGLKPAGASSYFQRVPIRTRKIIESRSNLALVRGGVEEALELGEDAILGGRGDPAPSLLAPAVFVGYGLVVPEKKHNDLAGIDLKGKIAVYLQGAPPSMPATLRAHYQSHQERWRFLHEAGAVGMASIWNPKQMEMPWERIKLARSVPSLLLAGERFHEAPGLRVSVGINPGAAGKWFAGSGHTWAEILALAQEGRPLPKFPLTCFVQARVAFESGEAASDNVVAVLPGTDPKLKDQYILLSAHLDHLGESGAIAGDSIYNGAMDNAGGVASLIEIARMLKSSPPKRSVLFAAVTGEEKGLLGSEYLAAFPPVRLESIVANLNLDMFLPLHKLTVLHVYGMQESTIGPRVLDVARGFVLRVVGDPEPERNLFIRSDQYSFIRRGVPSIYLKFGFVKGSPEEKLQKDWLRERYHSPSDDTRQPVDVEAAGRFNRLVADLILSIGNAKRRPRWVPGSFFRRYTQRAA